MFHKAFVLLEKVRRCLSRTEWTIRLLRLPVSDKASHDHGLLFIQIDGLGQSQYEQARRKRRMPFLERLIQKEHYRVHSLYSGLPSSTPAVQGELFYGVKTCVPEFSFMDKKSGRVFKMYDQSAAMAVEEHLREEGRGLLEGGSSYSNIFSGGAAETHFCASERGWEGLFRALNPLVFPFLFFLYIDIFLRTAVLAVIEFFLAVVDFVRGAIAGKHFLEELHFIPTRVITCIFLRELVVAGAAIDIARGLPIIHVNFIGYDEQAHRRGPSSLFAHWSLRGIDDAVARLWARAHRARHRDYDVWIYSDHGQEDTLCYDKIHGFSLQEALDRILEKQKPVGSVHDRPLRAPSQWSGFFRFFLRKMNPSPPGKKSGARQNLAVAMGPVGIVYLSDRKDPQEIEALALDLLNVAGVANVAAPTDGDKAVVWSKKGRFLLPDQAAEFFGADHPFLADVAEDLVRLCHHPDVGDYVLFGLDPSGAVTSFMVENGTHAGFGVHETGAFALLPQDAPVSSHRRSYLRPLDLREGALAFLKRESAMIFSPSKTLRSARRSLRIMTYNIHSAIGMDGRVSCDRIARVIARHNPDIVALQELDNGLLRTGGVDQARYLSEKLEMSFHFHPSFFLGDGQYGNAILSRFPMKLVEVKGYPKNGAGSEEEPRGAVWASIEVDGVAVNFINTHLSVWPKERKMQADVLCAEWLEKLESEGPLVVCGDLNAMPGSAVYRRLHRFLSDAQKGAVQKRPQYTWYGGYPLVRIDHVFVNSRVRVSHVHVPRARLERVASDHLPLIVEMELG